MKYHPEEARVVLRDNPSMPDMTREIFEAAANGTLKEYYAKRVRHLRYDYRDECPPVDVQFLPEVALEEGGKSSHVFKCQRNYNLNVAKVLQSIVDNELIVDRGIIDRIAAFVQSDFDFQIGDPKNEARVQRINAMLDEVLAALVLGERR